MIAPWCYYVKFEFSKTSLAEKGYGSKFEYIYCEYLDHCDKIVINFGLKSLNEISLLSLTIIFLIIK